VPSLRRPYPASHPLRGGYADYYTDRYALLPITDAYKTIIPTLVRVHVHDFFQNIGEIKTIANALMQLKGRSSLTSIGRFMINSTLGLAGFFDPSTGLGLTRQNEDFGQTLGYWGVRNGPYLVLPLLGPSTLRDTVGLAFDGIALSEIILLDLATDVDLSAGGEAAYYFMKAVDTRANIEFRYYQTGSPFEYELVRLLYLKKRELEIMR
jgi:phospholipid-binding lipoprotein MlaA